MCKSDDFVTYCDMELIWWWNWKVDINSVVKRHNLILTSTLVTDGNQSLMKDLENGHNRNSVTNRYTIEFRLVSRLTRLDEKVLRCYCMVIKVWCWAFCIKRIKLVFKNMFLTITFYILLTDSSPLSMVAIFYCSLSTVYPSTIANDSETNIV